MAVDEALVAELKSFIVQTLSLEDIQPQDIGTDEPLFGEGVGLDSLDALELGVALQKKYGIRIDAEADETKKYFSCVRNLATLVQEKTDSRNLKSA